MTNDPKRWVDDESAPPAMRAFLRDARLDAPTLDEETRRRVRDRIRPPSTRAVALVIALVAVAALAAIVSISPSAPPIALRPERDAGYADGGLDAGPSLEPIRMERTCDEREVDHACTVHVEAPRAYERLEVRVAYGIAAPTCEGRALDADGITRTSETTLELESGRLHWRGSIHAFRACGYDGDVLVATGAIEGGRDAPLLEDSGTQDVDGAFDFDLRVALDADVVDDDVVSFAVVRQRRLAPPAGSGDDGVYATTCDGDVVADIPRALALAFEWNERVVLPIHVEGERSPWETFSVCARDAAGALTMATDPASTYPPSIRPELPTVRTPSGDVPIDALQDGHLVLGRVAVTPLSSATPSTAYERSVSVVQHTDGPPEDTTLHRLHLADGHAATLPSFVRVWSVERHAFVALESLSAGEHVVNADEQSVAIADAVSISDGPYYGAPISRGPGTYFLDGVWVEGEHAGGLSVSASTRAPDRVIEVWPDVAQDCSVRATLELRDLAALRQSGARSVALVFAPHHGSPGALRAVDCASARIGLEVSVEHLALVPADAAGRRRLSVDMPAISESEDDTDRVSEIECNAGYAVLACVRDALGLHPFSATLGRWARSGASCFDGGTRVETTEGPRAIAALRPGQAVVADDGGRRVTARVERLVARGERSILALSLSSGAVLRVTAEHPLLDARTGTFREAGSFAIGDALRGDAGQDVLVVGVAEGGRTIVYDLSVTGPHTFFAEGIVAHNY